MSKKYIFEDVAVKYIEFINKDKMGDFEFFKNTMWDAVIYKKPTDAPVKFNLQGGFMGSVTDFKHTCHYTTYTIALKDVLSEAEMRDIQNRAEKVYQQIKKYIES